MRFQSLTNGGVGDAVVGAVHDLDGVARLVGVVLLQDEEGLVGLGALFAYAVLDPSSPCVIRRTSSALTATIQ